MDISNGEGVGISLFVQGCRFYCKNCFNPDTWDFNGGKEWTQEVEDKFIELANKPYIKRISILGGEPLVDENLDGVLNLVNKIRLLMPEKTIWLYTGYTIVTIMPYKLFALHPNIMSTNPTLVMSKNPSLLKDKELAFEIERKRSDIISKCDIVIDGRYIDSQRNIQLMYRGSKNQRVIDIKKSLQKGEVVLYCE